MVESTGIRTDLSLCSSGLIAIGFPVRLHGQRTNRNRCLIYFGPAQFTYLPQFLSLDVVII